MIKKTFSLIVLFLLVFSSFAIAQAEEDTCSGFFGWLGCTLFGSSEARAGKGWFDREDALVGKVTEDQQRYLDTYNRLESEKLVKTSQQVEKNAFEQQLKNYETLNTQAQLLYEQKSVNPESQTDLPALQKQIDEYQSVIDSIQVRLDVLNPAIEKHNTVITQLNNELVIEKNILEAKKESIPPAPTPTTPAPTVDPELLKLQQAPADQFRTIPGGKKGWTYATINGVLYAKSGNVIQVQETLPGGGYNWRDATNQEKQTALSRQPTGVSGESAGKLLAEGKIADALPYYERTCNTGDANSCYVASSLNTRLNNPTKAAEFQTKAKEVLTINAEGKEAEAKRLEDWVKANPNSNKVGEFTAQARTLRAEAAGLRAQAQTTGGTKPAQPGAPKSGAAKPASVTPPAPGTGVPETQPVAVPPAQAGLTDEKKQELLEVMQEEWVYAESALGSELLQKYTKAGLLLYTTKEGQWAIRSEVTLDSKNTFYTLADGGELAVVDKSNTGGYITVYEKHPSVNNQPPHTAQIVRQNNVVIASQTGEQFAKNTIEINGKTLSVKPGTNVDSITKEAIPFYGEENNQVGEVIAQDNLVTITNYDEETQDVFNSNTRESLAFNGDYYKEKDKFLRSGGTLTVKNDKGEIIRQEVQDYDYAGTGVDRKLSKVDVYDIHGNRIGAQFDTTGDNIPDLSYERKGDVLVATDLRTGEYKATYNKNEKGEWVDSATKEKVSDFIGKQLSIAEPSVTAATVTAFETVYQIFNSVKSYPAISKLLFGESEAYQDWQRTWDKAFAPMLGSNWFPSLVCEPHYKWRDNTPQGKAVIKTASGTYQAVASIQMEKSDKTSPILCQKNSDEEADEQWVCDQGQVCVDEQFCYADEDDEKPLQGYFYKITWAVSAPQDEALTLYMDENGVAVSFNIYIDTIADGGISAGAVPLYNRMGNLVSPIMLENGASDKDAIIKYSPNEYTEACIVWHQAPSTINRVAGTSEIPNVCFTAETSSIGRVEWEQAGQSSAKVSENKGEISRNSNW